MTLHQSVLVSDVLLDVQRRDNLWENDDYGQRQSPHTTLRQMRGVLRMPKFRSRPLCSEAATLTHTLTPSNLPLTKVATIAALSANAFHFAMKQPQNEFFTTSLYKIGRVIEEL